MDELRFDDLAPIEVPVSLGGRDYILREASEAARLAYQNAMFRVSRPGADGKPTSFEGLNDVDSILVSGCLFEQHGKNERNVPLNVVRSWPSRIVKALYEKARSISFEKAAETREVIEARMKADAEKLAALDSQEGAEGNGQCERLGSMTDTSG